MVHWVKLWNKRSIFYFGITNQKNQKNIENLPCVLFTGLHHANEPLSFTMNIYIMTKILFDFYHEVKKIEEVLKDSLLIFIPAINIDGYFLISEIYQKTKIIPHEIRKNRRNFGNCDRFDFLYLDMILFEFYFEVLI